MTHTWRSKESSEEQDMSSATDAVPTTTKRVQELSENCDGLPSDRYIQKESNRSTTDPPSCTIPVIDLSRLLQPGGQEEGDMLRSALTYWGLFQAVGHGIPTSLLDEVRSITRLFFEQPMQEKQKYFSVGLEGYGNDAISSDDQILDWSDRLYLRIQPVEERKMELWPETPTSFKRTLDEYSARTRTMVDGLLKALAKLLGLEEDHFVGQFGEKAMAYARFNYYPRCSRPELVFGIKPHADASVLTVVLQDPNVEGLQVFKDETGWVKVPIVPNALLVNMGDQMEIMSNGHFKSPVHRVVASPTNERISIAVFYAGEAEKEIEPADGLLGEGRPRLYKKVRVKDYLQVFYKYFPQGKRSIDWAKV